MIGGVIFFLFTCIWINPEDGKIKGVVYRRTEMKDKSKANESLTKELKKAKKKLEELKDWEDKYRSLFDRSLYCVFLHGLDGYFIDANKTALDLLEYKRKEISHLNFAALLDEEHLPLALKTMEEIKRTGAQKEHTQYRLKKKSGGEIWVETDASLIYKKGKPYAILGIARDVTEYKKTEEALRESEEKYRKIFESLTDVYYRTDREGIVTDISPSVITQAGWDPSDVIGHPVTDFYRDPEARDVFANTLRDKGIINDYELQLLAKDGRVIEVSASSHIIVGSRGQSLGVEGVLRDITMRKQMEGAVRESEQKFRTMVENSIQGIFIIQDFRIVYANDALAHFMGYSLDELLTLPSEKIRGIIHPEDQDMVWGRMADRLAGKDVPSRYVFRTIRKDGTLLWMEMVAGRIEFQGKPAVQGAIIDITDRHQAEEKIKASLREKEVMLREIHHRVKNNMQIILSLLRIQSRTVKDKGTRDMFKQSQNRIRSMALIHEALYKSEDLAKIDISDYLSRMSTHLLSIYREDLGDIKIIQKAEGIFLDINRAIPCGLIISELVSNCMKHAFPRKRHGQITIGMTKDKKGTTSLIVKDNGIGLPEGLDYRKTETLGLQLVTDLVYQINGSISVKKSQGTEFVIKF
jgi:PAS domain S-box-containing protein